MTANKLFGLSEKTLETRLKRDAVKFGCMFIKLTTYNGIPDRMILTPYGKAAFIELKSEGKEPRKLQLSRLRKLHSLGFYTKVINSEKSYLEFINDLKNDLQTRTLPGIR